MSNKNNTQHINTNSTTKNSTKNPTTTEKFNTTESILNITKEFQTDQENDNKNCSNSGELDIVAKSSIDSRNVFDTPCKSGYRRDSKNICRKVY